jgi:L-iditol 2-dehydrogenase
VYSAAVPKPVQLGHEVVGTVAAVGAGLTGWAVGQRIALAHHVPCDACHYCRHGNESMCAAFKASNISPGGFSEYVVAHPEHVRHSALPLPDSIPDTRAIFVEPLACCVRALRRLALQPGDSALVVGAGAMGLLFLALLRYHKVRAVALDLKPERLALAQRWGADRALDPRDPALAAQVQALSEGRGVDAAIRTVAGPATFAQALPLLRDGGAALIFGAKVGDQPAAADLWEIYRRELTVVSSYSAAPADLGAARDLLTRDDFALEELVSHELPLEHIGAAMALSREQRALKALIRPRGEV